MKAKVNKKQLNALLEILSEKLKEPRNSEIRESLRKMLDNADLKDLRDIMHLSGYKSVDYSFIQEDILRTQLEVDNLRMEDAACSTQIKNEEERFFIFCVNAFYQIENLTNYYFVKMFPNFSELLEYLEKNSNFKHKEDPKTKEIREKSVGDIDISCKIYALANQLFPSSKEQPDFTYKTISGLRMVRNEGFHRCQIDDKEHKKTLENFYRYNDYASIRELLRKYTKTICSEIERKNKLTKLDSEYTLIRESRQKLSKEYLDNVKSAKLVHYAKSEDGSINDHWAIVVRNKQREKKYINVHPTYFVKRYNLHSDYDVVNLLPRLVLFFAIHNDMIDILKEDLKQQGLGINAIMSFDSSTLKKYHIIEILELTEVS